VAGRLFAGSIRNTLEDAKFRGHLEYRESKGWLESEFTVKGSVRVIDALHVYLDEVQKIMAD
jgi:hypothetical protein